MDFNSTTIEQAAVEWAGREEADKMKSAYTINGEMKIPREMESALTVTGIKLSSFDVKNMQEKGFAGGSKYAGKNSLSGDVWPRKLFFFFLRNSDEIQKHGNFGSLQVD